MTNLQIFDSHCHLAAVKNSTQQIKIAIPAITLADIPELIDYRKFNPLAKVGFGLHPWFIKDKLDLPDFHNKLEQTISTLQPNFIGETGLDKNKPHFIMQLQLLEDHLKLAQKFDLPIILHCVRAYNELLEILSKFPQIRGVLHAYNGNLELARQLERKKIFLGIGSIILNEQSQLAKSALKLPSSQLLLESDAPYMPPPGKEHSSSKDCRLYAERLAELQNKSLTGIIHEANHNWERLFTS